MGFRIVYIIDLTHLNHFLSKINKQASKFYPKDEDKNNKTDYLCKSIFRILTTDNNTNQYVDSK
jgi:hypothetical protein